MIIEFNKDAEIEIVTHYDEANDCPETENQTFRKGDREDVDVLNDERNDGTIDVQFGDGSVCYGLLKSCFEIIAICPCCKEEGENGEGCPSCPGFWFTNDQDEIDAYEAECKEQQRRDEKNGLYPDKWDIAN